jgi:DNA-binding PadR family transcriptional regulator
MSPVFRHGRLRLYLLKLLDESPRHGYEVIRLLQDRFMGVYAPSPGTIYPRLARLEEEGLVTRDEADGRKVYRITDKGREELRNRSDDLSELEDEITASVRDIAREVTEDVRETVRNLREELTFAARDMHRRGTAPPRGAAPSRSAAPSRHTAPSRSTPPPRRTAPPSSATPSGHQAPPRDNDAPPPRRGPGAGSAWDQAVYEEAPHEEAPHGQAPHEEAPREHARREGAQRGETQGDQARGQQAGAGRDEAGQAHGPRLGWWAWPPGGSGWADPGTYRDLEHLARRFTRELRAAATQAQAVSEDAVGDLRSILDDALDRIKAEVFGAADAPGPDDPPRTGDRDPQHEHPSREHRNHGDSHREHGNHGNHGARGHGDPR